MCTYLSFIITTDGDILVGTGWSHGGVALAYKLPPDLYREAEWLDSGWLVIRLQPGDDEVEWENRVLNRYPDREALEEALRGKRTRAVINECGEVGEFVLDPPNFEMVGPQVAAGDLSLLDSGVTQLPTGLQVGGDLNLAGCWAIRSLPEGLRVGEDLKLTGCRSLTALPDNLWVGSDLYLIAAYSLSAFPHHLTVGGNLHLACCHSIATLPEGLEIPGNMHVAECDNLVALPQGLRVGGDLDIVSCPNLASIPSDVSVGRYLTIRDCAGAVAVPEGLKVGGGIYVSPSIV